MLCRSTCFEKVTLLQISFFLAIPPPKTQLFRKLTILNNFLFSRSVCSVEVCSGKEAILKDELLKKAAVLKKQLLRESNCCIEVVTLKKCEEVASSKTKPLFKSLSSRSSSMFKEFSLGCLVVGSYSKKEKLAEIATRCHSMLLDLSLVYLFTDDRLNLP